MKKTIFLSLLITFLAMEFGLAAGGKDVPAAVSSTFKGKYPGTKVSEWDYRSEQGAYVAEFKMNDKKKYAWFTPDGAWLATSGELKLDDLPPAVIQGLTTGEYKDWTFGDYREVDSPTGKYIKVKAKFGNEKEHHLKYNEAGVLIEKVDAKAGGKTLTY